MFQYLSYPTQHLCQRRKCMFGPQKVTAPRRDRLTSPCSTAARVWTLVRLVPIFWVIVGRKNIKKSGKNQLREAWTLRKLCCQAPALLCYSLCSPTRSSAVLSFSRKERCHEEETKPPSLQFWVSAWTAPCSRRWKCQLTLSPVVALSVIFPGEVSGHQYLWCQG